MRYLPHNRHQKTSKLSCKRRTTLLVACALVWLFLIWQVTYLQPWASAEWLRLSNFLEYWAAGRLQVTGNDPYSPELLLNLQQSVGWRNATPMMMWNPPWILSFVMPFGLLSYPLGGVLWLITLFLAVLLSAQWSWRFYGGSARHYWLAWVVGFTFIPTLVVLASGQIGPLILLGLVGFLHFDKRKQWWLAGVSLVLVSIKPHLVYLIWVALVLWVLDRRRWSVLIGGGVASLSATALPLFFNAAVIKQYLHALLYQPPPATPIHDWATPTLGGILRLFLGTEKFWLQFLPPFIGTTWFFLYWQRHKDAWTWGEKLPLVILVAIATTPYGWTFDQVVLLPAFIQAAAHLCRSSSPFKFSLVILIYFAINVAAMVMYIMRVNELWYFWMAPSLLLLYLILHKQVRQERLALTPK